MKLQIKNLCIIAAFILLSSGCGPLTAPSEEASNAPSSSQKGAQSAVPVALVTDMSFGEDDGFNQAALKGLKTYAAGSGIDYICYEASDSSPVSCKNAVLSAVYARPELIICVGAHFEQAVASLQEEYEDISFLLLDSTPNDSSGKAVPPGPNVHCITYREEESGYLVGYMAVLEGYRQFGFIGGEQLSSIKRYGYGYLQGIDDAAASLDICDDVEIKYWYADTFSPNKEIAEISLDWYQEGTEIIFACGGMLYQSVLDSAEACKGMLIGVDVDQSSISDLFLTSAIKGIDSSIVVALDEFFANGHQWPEKFSGKTISYGTEENCISLPVLGDAWRFEHATLDEYSQLLARLKSGAVKIPVHIDRPPDVTVTVIYQDQQQEETP